MISSCFFGHILTKRIMETVFYDTLYVSLVTAVLKVSEEQYQAVDKRYLLKEKKEFFGVACLTNEKQYYIENYPEIVVESGSLDQVILMLTGGER